MGLDEGREEGDKIVRHGQDLKMEMTCTIAQVIVQFEIFMFCFFLGGG